MLSAEFIDGAAGKILVVRHSPFEKSSAAVVVVPAFCEEMNKSRRLIWETGRLLGEAGFSVFVPDLFGTGDSEGEFEDATWDIWLQDLRCVCEYAQIRASGRLRVLAVRTGALLLAGLHELAPLDLDKVLLWQPVYQGSEVIRQMLRTRIMSLRMAGLRPASLEKMKAALLSGNQDQLLGGYVVTSQLALSLDNAVFDYRSRSLGASEGLILELGSMSVANTDRTAAGEEAQGTSVWKFLSISGERFWVAVEPGRNESLVGESVRFLST